MNFDSTLSASSYSVATSDSSCPPCPTYPVSTIVGDTLLPLIEAITKSIHDERVSFFDGLDDYSYLLPSWIKSFYDILNLFSSSKYPVFSLEYGYINSALPDYFEGTPHFYERSHAPTYVHLINELGSLSSAFLSSIRDALPPVYVCPVTFENPKEYGSISTDYYFKFTKGDIVSVSGDSRSFVVDDCFFALESADFFTPVYRLISNDSKKISSIVKQYLLNYRG